MKITSKILFILLLLFYYNDSRNNVYMVVYSIGISDLRVGIITSGNPNDLGFNYQINEAKVRVERFYKTKRISIFNNISVEHCDRFIAHLIDENGYNIIITTAAEHHDCALNISNNYPQVYVSIRGTGAADTVSHRNYIDLEYEAIYYITGFYAGLVTQSKMLGFIMPGPQIMKSYPSNAFFIGAQTANPDVTLLMYDIGSKSSPELSIAASNKLFEMGCDVIGQSLDDMSVTIASIASNHKAIGGNGYDQRTIFGKKVDISMTMNWTEPIINVIKKAIDGNGNIKNYFGSIGTNFIKASYGAEMQPDINREIYLRVLDMSQRGLTLAPYLCSTNNAYIFGDVSVVTGCLDFERFRLINEPYPGMYQQGNFTIPILPRNIPAIVSRSISITCGALIFLSLILMGMLVAKRDTAQIRSSSPVFCFFIIIGGIIVYIGILIWSLPPTFLYCHLRLWLVSIGFTTLLGCLVVKNFRVWVIFDNPELKAIKITNFQLSPWFLTLVFVNCILLTIITTRGEITLTKVMNVDDLTPYEYLEKCEMNQYGNIALYVLLAYFGCILVTGLFVSFKIRIVEIPEFNESKVVSITLYTTTFVLFIIVSLIVIPQFYLTQTIVLCTSGIFITTSALLIVFIPKFVNILSPPSDSRSPVAIARLNYRNQFKPDPNSTLDLLAYYRQRKNLANFTDDSATFSTTGRSRSNLSRSANGQYKSRNGADTTTPPATSKNIQTTPQASQEHSSQNYENNDNRA